MAVSVRWCVVGALLVVAAGGARAADEDAAAAEATVETIEEEKYESPWVDPSEVYFAEHFDDPEAFERRWVRSQAKKQGVDEDIAKYDGQWELQEASRGGVRGDRGLVLVSQAKHAAVAAPLLRPFVFRDRPLVVQYEVTMQEGQVCGGAYLKLVSAGADGAPPDLRQFHDQTPYTIMFGPDKCGNDHKLHFIFRHVNPLNHSVEEKHCTKPKERLEEIFKDKQPHLYTLEVHPDNSYVVRVDGREVAAGSLLDDFAPPVNPPPEVDDPADTRPDDWDEREQIPDPAARKPDDWDESEPPQIPDPNAVKPDGWLDDAPLMIPDASATKPGDWDDEMDGEWEAPLVDNPACAPPAPGCGPWRPPLVPNPRYKGVWRAPLVANPNYRGKWAPRRVPNPHYFRDDRPARMTTVAAVGFELWSMSPRLLFDNVLVTDDPAVAQRWAQATFHAKQARLAAASESWWGRLGGGGGGWWVAYAAYCAAPVVAYIALLVRRATEESAWERGAAWLAANPWAWGALLLALLLLLAALFYCCCSSASPQEPEMDPKKSDAYQEDDPSDAEGEGAAAGAGAGGARGKAQLEPQAAGDEAGAEAEATAEAEAEASAGVDADGGGDHQRRRKPRRE